MLEQDFVRSADRADAPLLATNKVLTFLAQSLCLGAGSDSGFIFDNEKWAHETALADFAIDSRPVSELEFADFIEAGGYQQNSYWSGPGRHWLDGTQADAPRYWRQCDGLWQLRRLQHWAPPSANRALCFVNAYEAEAYCCWRGGVLASASQWQMAAAHPEFVQAGQWEWTADTLHPYPGFSADPYQDYSLLAFGHCRELRGQSPLVHSGLCRPDFRNFFAPERRDVHAGFRCVRGGPDDVATPLAG